MIYDRKMRAQIVERIWQHFISGQIVNFCVCRLCVLCVCSLVAPPGTLVNSAAKGNKVLTIYSHLPPAPEMDRDLQSAGPSLKGNGSAASVCIELTGNEINIHRVSCNFSSH